jgi:hypothetical protein
MPSLSWDTRPPWFRSVRFTRRRGTTQNALIAVELVAHEAERKAAEESAGVVTDLVVVQLQNKPLPDLATLESAASQVIH